MSDLYLNEAVESGRDEGHGNLLGIQPFMLPVDYTSAQTLLDKLDGYFAAAQEKSWLTEKTIVVLPEYLGSWLVAAGEPSRVYAATTLQAAMRALALNHPLHFGRTLRVTKAADRTAAALFRMKALEMAQGYQFVFMELAKRYGVTVVAGSILLPEPAVAAGILAPGSGALQNVSAVFAPDGSIFPELSRKVYPTSAELNFVDPAPLEQLPVYETRAGRLGVLVCADSWYPAPYQHLKEQGVELLAVPSFVFGSGVWEQPWGGYDGSKAPADVELSDKGQLTEGQAWRKYALHGRIGQSGARAGINVFLRGILWDAGSDSGASLAVSSAGIAEINPPGAGLLNLWLPSESLSSAA
jgi:hypothetical protein